MRGIQIEDGGILYFGNKAGYIRNRRAVIDPCPAPNPEVSLQGR